MKRKSVTIFWIAIVILLIVGVIGFYVYDVIWVKTPYTHNLFRALAVVLVLLGTLIKLINGSARNGLDFYEKSYKDELGYAFKNKPFQRKKLLCACRLYNESNYRKALKYLFQLSKKAEHERDIVPVLLFIALCYTDAGIPEEAIRVYYDLLKFNQSNAQVHSNLGMLLVGEGDFDLALQHYNKAIEIKPKNYSAYTNRANLYFQKGNYDNAVSDAIQALEHKNNGVEAATLLAIIYALQGDEENKKKYYHLSITAGRSPQELNQVIAYYLSEKENTKPSDEEEATLDEE